MADTKYRAGVVAVNKEQMEIIEKAMTKFKEAHGATVTRSQMLAILAHWYVNNTQPKDGNQP